MTMAVLGAALVGSLCWLPAAAGAAPHGAHDRTDAASKYYLQAEIIPADDTAVGNSAMSGGSAGVKVGESLWANGVSDVWLTGNYTINFAVFVFSSHAESGDVEFKVVSPSKATVYSYSFKSENLPKGEDWFTFAAKANYATPGVYFAELYLGSNLDGWIPMTFNS